MLDNRTNYARDMVALLKETYGGKLRIFDAEIHHLIQAAEISAEGKSIYAHDPTGKAAEAYRSLTKEVLGLEKQRAQREAGLGK